MKRKLLFSRVADLLRSRAPGLRDEEQRIDLTSSRRRAVALREKQKRQLGLLLSL
jgi:hypothetical protein